MGNRRRHVDQKGKGNKSERRGETNIFGRRGGDWARKVLNVAVLVSCGDGGEEEGANASHGGHLPYHPDCQQYQMPHERLPGERILISI